MKNIKVGERDCNGKIVSQNCLKMNVYGRKNYIDKTEVKNSGLERGWIINAHLKIILKG